MSGSAGAAEPARKKAAEGPLWLLTCEHASASLPRSYASLGLPRARLREHIAWDPGALEVQREVARRLGSPRVAARWSRLLVDCNRGPDEPSLILAESDGVRIPGNERVSAAERRRRRELFYEPYHAAADRMIRSARRRRASSELRLLSIHSFTPVLGDEVRRFEVGVLFDDHEALARALGRELCRIGYSVRYNEPYSGADGLIYAARRHGRNHGLGYVEIELNNAMLRTGPGCRRVGADLAAALSRLRA